MGRDQVAILVGVGLPWKDFLVYTPGKATTGSQLTLQVESCRYLPVPCVPFVWGPGPLELPNLEAGEVKVVVSFLISPLALQSEACRVIEGEIAVSCHDPGGNGVVGPGGRGQVSRSSHVRSSLSRCQGKEESLSECFLFVGSGPM